MDEHSVVEIIWEDAWSNSQNNWSAESMKKEPAMILHSIGYLMNEDDRGFDFAEEWSPDQKDYRKVHHVPHDNIKEVRRLR